MGLFAMTYFLLIVVYVLFATVMALYDQAPAADRLLVLGGILADATLSIFRDSTRWLLGSDGLYSFMPTLALINSTDGFRSLVPHVLVQLMTFGFVGSFAASKGCSLTMALLLPGCLLGLTMSLLQARLLLVGQYNLTTVCFVVACQFIGIFLGSVVYSTRLR